MRGQFLLDRIEATKAQIIAYETAIEALGTAGGVQSYSLDTGQTRQSVTRYDLPRLTTTLDSLYNRLATLEARAYGGSTYVRPGW